MAILLTKPVTVLDKPKIEVREEYEYSQATFQVYTGKDGLAGEMILYSQAEDYKNPTDLQGFDKGEYEVDVEEIRDRRNGRITTRYANLRPLVKQAKPDTKGAEKF